MAGKPAKLLVSSGKVGRGSKFYPNFTILFEEGHDSGPFHLFAKNLSLVSMSSDIIAFYNSRFSRNEYARDAVVQCTWNYSADDVTLTATSQVEVLGQLQGLEVSDGRVTRSPTSGRFAPFFTVHYTDGSKTSGFRHVFGREEQRPILISLSPVLIERQLSHLARIPNVADGTVTCTWRYREGGTMVTGSSRVEVVGQPEALIAGSGAVTPGKKFYPNFMVKFSDGSTQEGPFHVFNIKNLALSSMTPEVLRFHTGGFELKAGARDGTVVCEWSYSEGDTMVLASSTVRVADS